MTNLRALANRAGAVVIGCVCAGFAVAALFTAWLYVGRLFGWWPGEDSVIDTLVYASFWSIAMALALGFVPAMLVLSFTHAKSSPWRSLPRLVAGSVIGVVLVSPVLESSNNNYIVFAALVTVSTLGGLGAALLRARRL